METLNRFQRRRGLSLSAGEVIASFFWDVKGISLVDHLERDKTVTRQIYATLLGRLMIAIQEKRLGIAKQKCYFAMRIPLYLKWHSSIKTGGTKPRKSSAYHIFTSLGSLGFPFIPKSKVSRLKEDQSRK
ncbi:hypothetical protein Y032_0105g3716 [Ancylostoma ceylanicum]|uniref:Uncharacterized protein n=1 Tax=Ancylostoma ceylanicum TaxID=53326 RepID=A0A016TGG0_9BILA|nr:hypothetical protein Y032_0105g3716 [Ancylostoma ceylanicum]